MQSVTIGKNQAGQRLDKFLHKYLPQAGNGFLYKMLRKKNITLNGKRAEGNEILSVDDQVRIFFSEETFAKFSGTPAPADKASGTAFALAGEYEKAYGTLGGIGILYEDEDFIILDKPSGILTQKAAAEDVSLNEWLIGYLLAQNPGLAEEFPTFRPSVCNRLDRNTSGIVLGGKSLAGLQYLSGCIKERRVRKFYLTICVGALRQGASIKGYLVKDREKNRVAVSGQLPFGREERDASPIQTAYTPLAVTKDYTLLEVELITGKPHQIRAHLAGMGHPLIGDYKYGSKPVNDMIKKQYGLEHHLLHACRVEFPESCSAPGKSLSKRSFHSPEPDLFLTLEKSLGVQMPLKAI